MATAKRSTKFVTKPKRFKIQDGIFVKVLMPQFCIPIVTNKQTVGTVLDQQLIKLQVLRPVLEIRIRMFCGLPDPDPFISDESQVWIRIRIRILPFSQKGVERTEIMLTK
jgi:hypothetical protein